MKEKTYIGVIVVLVVMVVFEGAVIYNQYRVVNNSSVCVRQLEEKLNLERRGLRHDYRGGDFCPACCSESVAKIVYGYWKPGMWTKEIRDKKIVVGGSLIGEYSKRFQCNYCGYRWGHVM